MYQNPVLAAFDLNYQLLASFGQYDSVYRHPAGTLPYACETLFALNRATGELVLTFGATANLHIYDAESHRLKYLSRPPTALSSRLKQNFVYLTKDATPPNGRKLSIFFNLMISPDGQLVVSTLENPEGDALVAYDGKYRFLGLFPMPLERAPTICHVDNDYIYFLGQYDEPNATRTIYRYKYRVE
jgi:hypothetical protein